jgi:hypothetical protein
VTDVVAPDRDDDDGAIRVAGQRDETLDEADPLGLVGRRREDFLELIDDQHDAITGRTRGQCGLQHVHRMLPRQEDRAGPSLAARKQADGEGRKETAADDR